VKCDYFLIKYSYAISPDHLAGRRHIPSTHHIYFLKKSPKFGLIFLSEWTVSEKMHPIILDTLSAHRT